MQESSDHETLEEIAAHLREISWNVSAVVIVVLVLGGVILWHFW
jgi:hypothetical protein